MIALHPQGSLTLWLGCSLFFAGCVNNGLSSRSSGLTDPQMVNLDRSKPAEGAVVGKTGSGAPSFKTKPHAAANPAQTADLEGANSRIALARLSERHGQTRQARELYEAELKTDPRNPLLHHRLAIIAAKEERGDEALSHFELAREMAPDDAQLLSDLGYTYYLQHRLEDAEATLRQAVAADPQNKAAHNNLGIVLGVRSKFDEALSHFTKGGSEAAAYANLGYVHAQLGDIDKALANYNRALSLDGELRTAAEALLQLHELKTKFDPQIAARAADAKNASTVSRGKAPDVEAATTLRSADATRVAATDDPGVPVSSASELVSDSGTSLKPVRCEKKAAVPCIVPNVALSTQAPLFSLSDRQPAAQKAAFAMAGFQPADPTPRRQTAHTNAGGTITTAGFSENGPGTVLQLANAEEEGPRSRGLHSASGAHTPAPIFSPSRRILDAQNEDAAKGEAKADARPLDRAPNRLRPDATRLATQLPARRPPLNKDDSAVSQATQASNRLDSTADVEPDQLVLRPWERPAELVPLSASMPSPSAMSDLQGSMELKHPSAQPTWSGSLEPQPAARDKTPGAEPSNPSPPYPNRRPLAQTP